MSNTAGADCLFCRITRGEHEAHIVFEGEREVLLKRRSHWAER